MRRMLRKFKEKFIVLQPAERTFVGAAWLFAPVVELSVRQLGLKRTLRWIEALPQAPARHTCIPTERARSLIDLAYAGHRLSGKCLERSVLQYGLQRAEDARFVLGVRNDRETFEAHAWVERRGVPTDDPACEGFQPLKMGQES